MKKILLKRLISESFMPSQEQVKLVESSLFIAGRPINIEDLKKLINSKKEEDVDTIIDKISKNLNERNSFIEIVKIENEYLMRTKSEIKKNFGNLQSRRSLSEDYMKLLAIIALKQPMKRADLKKLFPREKISERLIELEKKGFIQTKTQNKIKVLTTTPHFANVFNLNPENMKDTILKTLTQKISQQVLTPPKQARGDDKKKKETLTDEEKEEIDKRYYELMERLEKEREEEAKLLEEEAQKKAAEEEFTKKLESDPMAQLLKSQKKEIKIKNEIEKENTEKEEEQ